MALNFPDSPALNELYTDPTTGFTYQWNGEVWKSAVLSNPDSIKELTDISASFNGSTQTFALSISGASVTPVNAQQLIINLGGVIQNAGTDYTVSGSNITFTTAPASGLSFTGLFVGSAISLNSVASNSVEPQDLTTGGPTWNTAGGVRISGVATISNTGSATTALYVAGGARITGILTVGSSSVTIDGTNDSIKVGTGLTVNASGITAGIITATTFYGDGSSLAGVGVGTTASINTTGIITASYFYGSGIGITNAGPLGRISPITYSPGIGQTNVGLTTNIVITFNKPLVASSGTITLRTDSATGAIIESFDVGTSSSISISGGVLTVNPTSDLVGFTTYFLVVPEGCYKDKLNSSTNAGITTYSFTTQQLNFTLFAVGDGQYGQLDNNISDTTGHRSSPVQIPGTQWGTVNFDYIFSAALKTDGTLWTWGNNVEGQLGHNSQGIDRSSPTQVPGTQWNKLSTDQYHVFAIKNDGTLWGIGGRNQVGELGQNFTGSRSSPVQIPGTQWSEISGQLNSEVALKTDGTLWSWGIGSNGCLAQNNTTQYSSPRQIPGTQWTNIYSGNLGSVAKKTDGTFWIWGANQYGQLGLNDQVNRSSPIQLPGTQWSAFSLGYTSALGVKTDGTLWAWGYNTNYGALGLNDVVHRSSPTQIPGTQWNKVNAHYYRSYATKTDNTLWAWGYNNRGQLGQNDVVSYSSPRQIPGTQWVDPFAKTPYAGFHNHALFIKNE
jgi:hypothetical protein